MEPRQGRSPSPGQPLQGYGRLEIPMGPGDRLAAQPTVSLTPHLTLCGAFGTWESYRLLRTVAIADNVIRKCSTQSKTSPTLSLITTNTSQTLHSGMAMRSIITPFLP